MKKKEEIILEKSFEFFLLVLLISLFFYLIKSFLVSLLLASALVFLLYKPFLWLEKKVKSRSLASLLMVILVLILILVPMFWLTITLISELNFAITTSQGVLDTGVNLEYCNLEICSDIEQRINTFEFDEIFTIFLNYVSKSFENIFNSITDFIINFFIFLFAVFFMFKDGESLKKYLIRVVPIELEKKRALFLKFRDISEAIFLNVFFVAIIQGTLTAIAFYVVGFSSPIFWGVVAGFTSLLPLFGPALVWIPAALFLLLTGDFIQGVGLLGYGLFIISTSDNIARAYLLKHSVHVHELLIFLSLLGGIKVFGFLTGIFMGPLIISLLIAMINVYDLDFR